MSQVLGLIIALIAEALGIKGLQYRKSKTMGNARVNVSHRGISFGLSRKRKKK